MNPDCQIIHGDCRSELAKLPEKSIHCVVTSPPYWGLRCYEGVKPSVWGLSPTDWLEPNCHQWKDDGFCKNNCGAWRGLLGLEPTIEMYVEHIVECFRAVKRVLRDDGCLFLNLGDSYCNAGSRNQGGGLDGKRRGGVQDTDGTWADAKAAYGDKRHSMRSSGIKHKDLIGQPWRVAFALQADGWYLRSDIIWHKPNPMPESVTDRPTRAHEYLFLLTKKPKYYYDAEAVRETGTGKLWNIAKGWIGPKNVAAAAQGLATRDGSTYHPDVEQSGRNKRTVWTIPTEANPEAHFASFPRRLVLPCVLAGTSEKGCCPECGTPWVRVVERARVRTRPGRDSKSYDRTTGNVVNDGVEKPWRDSEEIGNRDPGRHVTEVKTLGWEPGCKCLSDDVALYSGVPDDGTPIPFDPVPCTVLDPFVGSGTAGIVATQQGRNFIGIDASETYANMARRRIADPEPEPEPVDAPGQFTMFEEAKA